MINLSTDKPAVLAEMFRVLVPTGRIGISDVVAEDRLSWAQRADAGSYVGCIAGALSVSQYLDGLAAAGFADSEVVFTHQVADGLHGAIIRAAKPAAGCCTPADQAGCCEASAKAHCCGVHHSGDDGAATCGCRCWELDDPAGQGVEAVRPIRDDIRECVISLIAELLPTKPLGR